jgi:hypothetical protein
MSTLPTQVAGFGTSACASGALAGRRPGVAFVAGPFEGCHDTWLRMCDSRGKIIPTGEERAAALAERPAEREARLPFSRPLPHEMRSRT